MRRFETIPHAARVALWLLAASAAAACGRESTSSPSAPAGEDAVPTAIAAQPEGADPRRDEPGPADRVFGDAPADRAGRWYGVYQGDKKVGHARVVARRAAGDEPGRWVSEVSMHVEVPGGAAADALERKVYAGGAGGRLTAGDYVVTVGGERDARHATFARDATLVTRAHGADAPGVPTRCPPSAETVDTALATAPPRPGGLEVGASTTVPAWDWEACRDDALTVTALTVGPRQVAGVEVTVAELRATLARAGTSSTSVVLEGGVALTQGLGPAFTLRLEDEAVAKSGAEALDIAGTGVAVARALGPPAAVSRLELSLTLPPGVAVPSDARQTVTIEGDGRARVVIRRAPGDLVGEDAAAAALAADSASDWRDPAVTAAAREATAGLTTDAAKVDALVPWVARRLRDRVGVHVPTASRILAVGEGDCTEHTWLFVALSRAVGVPARPVYGLVYTGDDARRFAFHAWAEVRLDGRWVAVDPTWDERVADATHLALSRDGFERLATFLGDLAIEVVDVARDAP